MLSKVYLHSFNFPLTGTIEKKSCKIQAKDVLVHLFENANNFELSDAELHSKLFGDKQDGIRIMWEYINMMIQFLRGAEFLIGYPKDNNTFQVLTNFYDKNESLPLSAEKSIIGLFRKMMMYHLEVEDIQTVQKV